MTMVFPRSQAPDGIEAGVGVQLSNGMIAKVEKVGGPSTVPTSEARKSKRSGVCLRRWWAPESVGGGA
jgi:hypothetical protein